ncbi:hypothetical protein [Serratia marcescens]|uniref:hypothetical protein n=1 Tax=Serratia marcescens TaxID=615 RepID=UPI0012FD9253|nr:hypothetical protein [Serratia marcescens]
MDSGKDEQYDEKANDPKDDAGVTVQIHTALACKQVGSDEEGDTECRVYQHHDGGKDEAYSEGC